MSLFLPTRFINNNVVASYPALSSYVFQGSATQSFNNTATFFMDPDGTSFYIGQGNNAFNYSGVVFNTPYEALGGAAWNQTCRCDDANADPNVSQIRFDNTYSGIIKTGGDKAYIFGKQNGDTNDTAVSILDLNAGLYSINNTSNSSPKSAIFESRHTLAPQLGFELSVFNANMRPDGKRIICQSAANGGDYYQLDLAIAWDMSTLSYSGVTLAQSTDGPKNTGFIPPYGKDIYSYETVGGLIRRHAIPIAWDLSSISTSTPAYQTRNIKNDIGNLITQKGLYITANRIFVFDDGGSGSNDKISQYNV